MYPQFNNYFHGIYSDKIEQLQCLKLINPLKFFINQKNESTRAFYLQFFFQPQIIEDLHFLLKVDHSLVMTKRKTYKLRKNLRKPNHFFFKAAIFIKSLPIQCSLSGDPNPVLYSSHPRLNCCCFSWGFLATKIVHPPPSVV